MLTEVKPPDRISDSFLCLIPTLSSQTNTTGSTSETHLDPNCFLTSPAIYLGPAITTCGLHHQNSFLTGFPALLSPSCPFFTRTPKVFVKYKLGISLVVQWLRLFAFNAGMQEMMFDPWLGNKIPYAPWCC